MYLADDSAGTSAGEAQALQAARGFAGLSGMDLAQEVTAPSGHGRRLAGAVNLAMASCLKRTRLLPMTLSKRNILRILASKGCDLTWCQLKPVLLRCHAA